MALYWPEAKFALDLMEGGERTRVAREYPPGVLVLSVREEQVDDPEFLEEVRELIIRRSERFGAGCVGGEHGTGRPEAAMPKAEHGIPSISDLFEGLVAQEGGSEPGCDDDECPDGCLDDCLGRALEIGYGLAASGAPQVQLVINGCRDVIVRSAEVA